MAQGNYDHPSYLTRQQLFLGATTAAAGGTSCRISFLSAMRIRNVSAVVQVAGTQSAGEFYKIQASSVSGTATSSLGVMTSGTSAVGTIMTSGDLNVTLGTGTILSIVGPTSAAGVANVTVEAYLDPAATWTGSGN